MLDEQGFDRIAKAVDAAATRAGQSAPGKATPSFQADGNRGTIIHVQGGNHAPISVSTVQAPAPPAPADDTVARFLRHAAPWPRRWLAVGLISTALLVALRLSRAWDWRSTAAALVAWTRGRPWLCLGDIVVGGTSAIGIIIAWAIYMRLTWRPELDPDAAPSQPPRPGQSPAQEPTGRDPPPTDSQTPLKDPQRSARSAFEFANLLSRIARTTRIGKTTLRAAVAALARASRRFSGFFIPVLVDTFRHIPSLKPSVPAHVLRPAFLTPGQLSPPCLEGRYNSRISSSHSGRWWMRTVVPA